MIKGKRKKKTTPRAKKFPLIPALDQKEKNKISKELLKKLRVDYIKAIRKKSKTTSKGGRPPKYLREETTEILNVVAETLDRSNFFDYCSVDSVCLYLDISQQTFNRWIKKHKAFRTAVRRWEQKRNSIFYIFSLKLKPAVWIFLAKNWLGLNDRQITELEMKGTLISQYISHIPPEKEGYRVKKGLDPADSQLIDDLTEPIIDDIEAKDSKEKNNA